ncbi:MAG: hypothetical protein ACTHYQ_06840, partial [Lactobacillus amylovorus]
LKNQFTRKIYLHKRFDSFILLIMVAATLVSCNVLAYYIYFCVIGIIYCLTYYFLIELYRRVENDLGGHKYFIDLPDNRFAHKY